MNQARTPKQKWRTSCKRGHPIEGDNINVNSKGYLECRKCRKIWWRAQRARAHKGKKKVRTRSAFVLGESVSVLTPEMKRDNKPAEQGIIDKVIVNRSSYIYRVAVNGHHHYEVSTHLLKIPLT